MSQQELLVSVVRRLNQLGIPYLLTGSLASSLQGEPRATHDIDLLVDLQMSQVDALADQFPQDEFYLSRPAVRQATQQRRMFNLLDLRGGDKVDFWLLTDTPFDQSRFARRQRKNLGDVEIDVSSPEDTILMKLQWSKASGGSEKQFQDALHVWEVQEAVLDRSYLESWLDPLGIRDLWTRLLTEAEPIDE